MRRSIILATLTLLLLAVAGASVAQDGFFAPGNETVDPGSTGRESTTPEPTPGLPAESTVEEELLDIPEETTAERRSDEGTHDGGQEDGNDGPKREAGQREKERGAEPGGGGPGGPGENGPRVEPGGEKITVCHKDKKTLTVGAPAEPAHLGHGDRSGPC
jgi:hypothetical protein